ncbi:hypothetical protein BC835DRAFT_173841 [Cytidiella melzeri]|nr:hypothetical protein BC835DRAFT_173841 [Cytidiella melzeri]
MEQQSLADLARQYGLDASEYEGAYNDEYIVDDDEPMGFDEHSTEYGDVEGYDTPVYSSPCPPGRPLNAPPWSGQRRVNHSRYGQNQDSSYYATSTRDIDHSSFLAAGYSRLEQTSQRGETEFSFRDILMQSTYRMSLDRYLSSVFSPLW